MKSYLSTIHVNEFNDAPMPVIAPNATDRTTEHLLGAIRRRFERYARFHLSGAQTTRNAVFQPWL